MPFWSKKEKTTPAPRSPVPASNPLAPSDRLLDSLASLLRILGQLGFDTEETPAADYRARCEAWALHVLSGMPEPGREADGPRPTSSTLQQRNWPGLLTFVKDHRREEQRLVSSLGSLGSEFRTILWSFVASLRVALAQDSAGDELVSRQLTRLGELASSGTLEQLREQAGQVVAVVSRTLSAREQRYRSQLDQLGTELRRVSEALLQVSREAERDPLTDLYNRRALDQALQHLVDLCFVSRQPCCLLLVDLDHFKRVNDTHGHRAGDEVLKQVAAQLVRSFPRRSDFVARFGGEEFAVLLRESQALAAERLGWRFCEALRALSIVHEEQTLSVTASVGVAELRPGEAHQQLVERADRALYRAKREGRDRVVIDAER